MQNGRAFELDRVQQHGIQLEGAQDRWRYLCCDDGRRIGLHAQGGQGHQKGYVTVVRRVAAMLGILLLAVRVDHARVGLHDDVRRSTCGRIAELGHHRSPCKDAGAWAVGADAGSAAAEIRVQCRQCSGELGLVFRKRTV